MPETCNSSPDSKSETITTRQNRHHLGRNAVFSRGCWENSPFRRVVVASCAAIFICSTIFLRMGPSLLVGSGGINPVESSLQGRMLLLLGGTSRSNGNGGSDRRRTSRPTLRFNKLAQGEGGRQYEFKILQITDIHLGEAPHLDWGPRQDLKTWKALDAILTAEAPVDLIVLSGDQLTGNNCKDNATSYYQELGNFLLPYGIPWAMIFGNHDDTDYEPNDGTAKIPARYLREDLLAVDQSFPLSLTQAGPTWINGTTNYILDIYHDDRTNDNIEEGVKSSVAAQILFLDSGGGSIEEAITDSQVDWVREITSQNSAIPAVAFQHIPTESHVFINRDGRCEGLHEDGLNPIVYDGGIVDALIESNNRFLFLAVGHNHGNDYCCPYGDKSSLHLCFGRHSGHGGYGPWEVGSRVYKLQYSQEYLETMISSLEMISLSTHGGLPLNSEKKMQWSSWVRLESAEVVSRFDPL